MNTLLEWIHNYLIISVKLKCIIICSRSFKGVENENIFGWVHEYQPNSYPAMNGLRNSYKN